MVTHGKLQENALKLESKMSHDYFHIPLGSQYQKHKFYQNDQGLVFI
jgi:hypothetical protein